MRLWVKLPVLTDVAVKGRMHPFSDPFDLAGALVAPLLIRGCRRLCAITAANLQAAVFGLNRPP